MQNLRYPVANAGHCLGTLFGNFMKAARLFVPICALVCTLPAQEPSSDVDRREAQALWEQMIVAKGGRERVAAIHSIEETRQAKLLKLGRWWVKKDTETQHVTVIVPPDRMWSWADDGATVLGLSLVVCNRSAGTTYDAHTGLPVLSTSDDVCGESLLKAQLIYLNENAGVHPEPVRVIHGREIPRGVDVIETKVDAYHCFRVDFYIDKHSHLPAQMILWYHIENHPGRPHDVTERYELLDYVEMEGVMIPRKVIETRSTGTHFEWGYQVRLNVPYRDEAFTEPPSLQNGPYAWMPKGETKPDAAVPP